MSRSRRRVAITGANGFIGSVLATRLMTDGYQVRGLVRRRAAGTDPSVESIEVGDLNGTTDLRHALDGVDVVVHLAARTHALHERGGGSLSEYRPVNVEATRRLTEAAARSGVTRLLFVSSIKVNGERTTVRPFTAQDTPAPEDAYGISKWEAEQVVAAIARDSDLEWVVVRPPLVYGPGVKGNVARLCRAVRSRLPLPLGAIENRRSLVAVDNLADLIARCLEHPAAAGRTFLVSDGEDLSTPELIRRLGAAMGRHPKLLNLPPELLRLAGRITGRRPEMDRLMTSLQVDLEETRRTLDWTPRMDVDEALRRMVADV